MDREPLGIYFKRKYKIHLYILQKKKSCPRDGQLIMVNDERMLLKKTKAKLETLVWTLGCYPLTGAIKSNATTLDRL